MATQRLYPSISAKNAVPEVSPMGVQVLHLCARHSLGFDDHARIATALNSSQMVVDECVRKLIHASCMLRTINGAQTIYKLSLKGQTLLSDIMARRPELLLMTGKFS